MPTRSTRSLLVPARLNRLAAGLTLAAAAGSPALAAAQEDGADSAPAVRTWSGPEQIVPGSERSLDASSGGVSYGTSGGATYGGPLGGSTTFVETDPNCPDRGLRGGHGHGYGHGEVGLHALRQDVHAGLHGPVRNPLPLHPALGGYDAYLPPDHNWQQPIAYPVQREVYRYNNWYPEQWYGLPGSQKPRIAPHVFMPTDTTQLGYYYQQVPTWQPAPPGTFPAPPDPRVMHHFTPPGGPTIAAYPGNYPGERRVLNDRWHHGDAYDPVTGHTIYGDVHGVPSGAPYGGTIVAEPAPTVNYGPALGVDAPPAPDVQVEPLPSSTAPSIDSDELPGAPVPDDAILPPEGEV
ncbi:hypothetical protein [Alienimonas californiensis]|uniref:Uncharacterized protein n=1 Tax=Alienimonas californiensis TaxID=2527989 RepID=A0A517P6A7_9PLAN|nr:hypothetical protein [Alienimonas californiensis]QDT14902.1 hypothetical protein CA12_09820 [Alienimonas californiensis]